MKLIVQFATILYCAFILTSCQKDFSNSGNPPAVTNDVDAQKFVDSSGISDSIQKQAVKTFVKQLKDSSLWSKFKAIYPMVGGTANSAKWNLKDPRNTDDAFRLTFNGAPVFASTGVLFPTSADYADSHLSDALLTFNDNAISYYSRTQNNVPGYDMGCDDNTSPYNELATYIDTSYTSQLTTWFGFTPYVPIPISTGLVMVSSSAANSSLYRNGINIGSSTMPPGNVYTNMSILIGSTRGGPSGHRECAMATIGSGLNDTQAMTFYNIVQNFQSKLGR